MITNDILNYITVGDIFSISPVEILFSGQWISGDYKPHDDVCSCDDFYHDCGNRSHNLQYVLQSARTDEYYSFLYKTIKSTGFKSPLSAIITNDYQSIVLIDGHHRLAAALDLKIKEIPVYISPPGCHLEDLIAVDSGVWKVGELFYAPLLDKKNILR